AARNPSTSDRTAGDNASYAAYILEKHVSPPTAGSCTARRIDPIGGLGMNVLSLCHSSAPSPFGLTWSSTVTVGRSWYLVASGGAPSGPQRSPKAGGGASVISLAPGEITRGARRARPRARV